MADIEALAKRLDELSHAVSQHNMGEFTMRVPAEPRRDADIVLLDAATELVGQQTQIETLESRLAAIRRYIMGCEERDIVPWNYDNAIERCSGLENLFLTDFKATLPTGDKSE